MKSREEVELDRLVRDYHYKSSVGRIPIHELFLTTFSLAVTIILFIYTDILTNDIPAFGTMLDIANQSIWAIAFLVAGVTKGIGLLTNVKILRILGLSFSSVLYFLMGLAYATDFPSITAILYAAMSVYAVISIFQVKITNIKEDN